MVRQIHHLVYPQMDCLNLDRKKISWPWVTIWMWKSPSREYIISNHSVNNSQAQEQLGVNRKAIAYALLRRLHKLSSLSCSLCPGYSLLMIQLPHQEIFHFNKTSVLPTIKKMHIKDHTGSTKAPSRLGIPSVFWLAIKSSTTNCALSSRLAAI
jgi:hypothetical protein